MPVKRSSIKLIQDDSNARNRYPPPVNLHIEKLNRGLGLQNKIFEMEVNNEVFDSNGVSICELRDNLNEEIAIDDDPESQVMHPGQGSAHSQGDLIAENPQDIPERPQLKSAVMLVATFWHSKYHTNKVNELLESSFTQDEMYENMAKVAEMLSLERVKKSRSTNKRSGGAGQAQAFYQLLEDLDCPGTTPEFVVSLEEMEEVQRALTNSSLAIGDSVQVGAMLESLEKGIKDLRMKIGAICIAPGNPAQVTETTKSLPNVIVSEVMKNTFANIAAKPVVEKTKVTKQRSNSQKRSAVEDDDGFNPVKKKKSQGKSGKGTFKVLESAENKCEVFISNVAPQTKVEEMSANIVECYDDFTKDKYDTDPLTEADIEVKDMTPVDYINLWRRSWWVAIPYRMKAVFEDKNFYPNQWKF